MTMLGGVISVNYENLTMQILVTLLRRKSEVS
jgi:hypothetical protein